MKYTEHRNLSADDVRSLCISKEWYTRGDCQAYSNLLNSIYDMEDAGTNFTADKLAEIAKDIKDHSETDYTIEAIMWELNRISNVSFSIAEH